MATFRPASRSHWPAAALLLTWFAAAGGQPVAVPALTALPIELDAEYSELDRGNDRLIFRGLRIAQGDLTIVADHAEASPADIANSRWVFTGNVVVANSDARVAADRAEMAFSAQRLRLIRLRGAPARFDQVTPRQGLPTAGGASDMEYDLVNNVVLMSGDAWLSDGQNEIFGARIAYDLRNERVTADADESGQVRLRITPPERSEAPAAP